MVIKSPKDFINLISSFDPQNGNQKKELENIIFKFPYFQLAHAIYLKSLKAQDQFNFDMFLKKTAILSSRRKLIFNWIENNQNSLFKIMEKESANEIIEPISVDNLDTTTVKKDEPEREEQKKYFVDWVLSYSNFEKKIENLPLDKEIQNSPLDKEIQNSPLDSKIEIIDSFLEKNPKIPNVKEKGDKDDFLDLASDNKFNKSELMTETLAKIYFNQKKIQKAIYAYKILSLKYPEKSSFFANQIKKLQKKQNKKP